MLRHVGELLFPLGLRAAALVHIWEEVVIDVFLVQVLELLGAFSDLRLFAHL